MQETMLGLWEHSMGCSITARLIAKRVGLKDTEEISVSALLHDIGKVVLVLQYPERYEYAMKEAQDKGVVICSTEEGVFPATHAEVGSWITEKWRFPRSLTDVIRHHHKPHLSRAFSLEASIVYLADILVRARGFGFAGDSFVPTINPAVWERLEMTEESLRDIFREMEDLMEGADDLILE
jgi:putative nucleotidyltransferase with HDIG domain